MKKYHIKYLTMALLAGIITLIACTKLDEKVYDKIIAEEYSPSAADVFSMIGNSYTQLRTLLFTWHGNFDTQEECSDIIVTPERPNGWVDGGVYRNMHMHNWGSSQAHFNTLWTSCYTGITNCNSAIYKINKGILVIATGKDSVLAELRVLRAFYYYVLCDNFGNVPIVTRYDLPTDSLPAQNTRKEVYDFIISEVAPYTHLLSNQTGCTSAPASNSTKLYYGRVNKWVAYTLLAKVYQNAEQYTEVLSDDGLSIKTAGTAEWSKCIAYCDSVINGGQYALETSFTNNFITLNRNSPEHIFAVAFDNTSSEYGWFHLFMKTLHPQNLSTYDMVGNPPWDGCCGIPQFINSYDSNDGRLKNTWIMGQQFSSSGDTLLCSLEDRFVASKKPLAFVDSVPSIDSTSEYDGYRIGKFEIAMNLITSGDNGLSNSFPIFRYAEILMMKAEGLLRTGNADAAATLVTEVRLRNFANAADAMVTGSELQGGSNYVYGVVKVVNGKQVLPGASSADGSDIQYGRFLDELGWEFAAEAHRRQDLIRFGVFTTKSWLSKDATASDGDALYRNIFPIPLAKLNTNSNLKQNPGY